MLGVAAPSFGAAHTLDLLIHGSEKHTCTEQTLQLEEAIESQARAFMTDKALFKAMDEILKEDAPNYTKCHGQSESSHWADDRW